MSHYLPKRKGEPGTAVRVRADGTRFVNLTLQIELEERASLARLVLESGQTTSALVWDAVARVHPAFRKPKRTPRPRP